MAEQILAMMVFRILGETIGSLSLTKFHGIIEVGKNCFYRLLARSEMNWRILQLSMARRFQSIVRKENAEETEAPKCYIVNDTTVAKTGLHFEGLSRVFDHVLSKCVLGYKLLLLAFFDRCSTYAVDLSMHREAGKKGGFSLSKKERSMQFHKERSESNPDYERFKELDAKKNDNVVKMIERAYKFGICAAYALMDTWFVKPPLVCAIRKIAGGAIHVVGRLAMGKDKCTLEIIKNLLNVLAVKLCINVADTLENLMEGTQTVSELEAILMCTFAHSYLVFLQIQK